MVPLHVLQGCIYSILISILAKVTAFEFLTTLSAVFFPTCPWWRVSCKKRTLSSYKCVCTQVNSLGCHWQFIAARFEWFWEGFYGSLHEGNFFFTLPTYYVHVPVSFMCIIIDCIYTVHVHVADTQLCITHTHTHTHTPIIRYLSNDPDTLVGVEVDDCSEVITVVHTVMHNKVRHSYL